MASHSPHSYSPVPSEASIDGHHHPHVTSQYPLPSSKSGDAIQLPSANSLHELVETLRKQNEIYNKPQTGSTSGSPSTGSIVDKGRRMGSGVYANAYASSSTLPSTRSNPDAPASSSGLSGEQAETSGSKYAWMNAPTTLPSTISTSLVKKRKISTSEEGYHHPVSLKSAIKPSEQLATATSTSSSSKDRQGSSPILTSSIGPSILSSESTSKSVKARNSNRLDTSISLEFRNMPFSKALPKISGLLEDSAFLSELKQMKADQDALEKTLWGERQALTRAMMAQVQRASQGTSTTRFGSSVGASDRKAELKAALDSHHLNRCLPALDDLQIQHQIRLEELGVPGLGNGGADQNETERQAMQARRLKIMGLLEEVIIESAE